MDIKEEHHKIVRYINTKLLTGDYTFISCGDHTASIRIDNTYIFSVWTANGPESCGLYSVSSSFLGDIPDLLTEEEHVKIYNRLMPQVKEYKLDILINKKREELDKLEAELSNRLSVF